MNKRMRAWWRSKSTSTRMKWILLPAIALAGLLSTLVSLIVADGLQEVLLNLGTELIGAVVIFLLVDQLIGGFERLESEQKQAEQHKKSLLLDLRSMDQPTASRALEELRSLGWLEDGTLELSDMSGVRLAGSDLVAADLTRVILRNADLEGASLQLANLQDADLTNCNLAGANLSDATLTGADLERAVLAGANLSNAMLTRASLQRADLQGADLTNANLFQAKLQSANLQSAIGLKTLQLVSTSTLRGALLPDGERYDGRYRLEGDLDDAHREGLDIYDDRVMSEFYGVTVENYRQGQAWRASHLEELNAFLQKEINPQPEEMAAVSVSSELWEVRYSKAEDIWILQTAGNVRIDSITGPDFKRVLDAVLAEGARWLIIGLRGVNYMSSMGLSVLVSARQQTFKNDRGAVVLYAVPDHVRDVLDLTGIKALFPTFDSLPDAMAEIRRLQKEAAGRP